jgi:hypothetical protein
MTLRLMPALCILLLAGCTSSEPQKASYAPLVEEAPAPMPMPAPPPAPALQSQAGQFPVNGGIATPRSNPALQGEAEQITASGIAAPALQPGCNTVDNVTLCDVPADPSVDDTHYTN